MPETTKVICITCPKGCRLDVTREGATVLKVENCGCKRGEDYVKAELSDPRRMVATTVRIKGGIHPLMPVYTDKPFPKPRIRELLDALRTVELIAPVRTGEVVVEDMLGTGIDILASREMLKEN
jgi:CxxC motif-containing protein